MIKYELFVGLNDRKTEVQEITTENALNTIYDMVFEYTDGATVSVAKGVYKHHNGSKVLENTVKIELMFIDKPTVKALVELLKAQFNQESVAVNIYNIDADLW